MYSSSHTLKYAKPFMKRFASTMRYILKRWHGDLESFLHKFIFKGRFSVVIRASSKGHKAREMLTSGSTWFVSTVEIKISFIDTRIHTRGFHVYKGNSNLDNAYKSCRSWCSNFSCFMLLWAHSYYSIESPPLKMNLWWKLSKSSCHLFRTYLVMQPNIFHKRIHILKSMARVCSYVILLDLECMPLSWTFSTIF